jgi:cobaltochelatase CobN
VHLLAATPGGISDGSEAVDLGQSPGDLVVLSAADSELASLSNACQTLEKGAPSVRLANLLNLGHNMSVDLYVDSVISSAKLVIVRLLGGRGYWPYGVEQIAAECFRRNIPLALLPGDDQPDAELATLSTLEPAVCHRLWQYCVHGGPANALQFLNFANSLIDFDARWLEPQPLLRAGLYGATAQNISLEDICVQWVEGQPTAALVFYRALVQGGNLKAVDAMISGLKIAGLNPLPVFVASLKDPIAAATLTQILDDAPPDVILNATGFAVSTPGAARTPTPLTACGVTILQVVFSSSNLDSWKDGQHGLSARDIAMNVALPEVDGHMLSRAVSFKGLSRRDAKCETDIVTYEPVADRVAFVCQLAAKWAKLKQTATSDRRVALILANYPNRDGRIGNGVGLDTPQGSVSALTAMKAGGYDIDNIPANGDELIARLVQGPTNSMDTFKISNAEETLSLEDYRTFFDALPGVTRRKIIKRWGAPEADAFMRCDERFAISAYRLGKVAICLQPARGYNIDPQATYHDPDLVPPHGYLAFYAWVRKEFGAHAIIHFGKHGNLEWLPGKSLALSSECFPEAALGPMPHLYPFIVNDPGEGTQAKRRASAVIIDHLTPPLTRAESYGPLADLELLVDEFYEASGVDPRRLKVLRHEILTLCAATGLDADCGMDKAADDEEALGHLDNYLCELKEMQIRDGLHIFGQAPQGRLLTDLLVALVRVPRGTGEGGDASLLRALAHDLDFEFEFDPLDCDMGAPWQEGRPDVLTGEGSWRSHGDTVERLEGLAARLVSSEQKPDPAWSRTVLVLKSLEGTIKPAVMQSGDAELAGMLCGLDARFVEPGPSGAPTRGRPDVLPTGRNFYSIDTRTVPTPAAWTLGWKSASLLIEHHRQEHGEWPRSMAISAWGTSNMRTGGDDIAQGLALMGVKPTWDSASRRVTGFEILPLSILDRPRVDVTLRVSGFFRDAFPGLIDLFASAARTVAALDETKADNPLAAKVHEEVAGLVSEGVDEDQAALRAGYRVFGSMPGAYGAGLQALIDEKGWQDEGDLARAYVAWGGYAYGEGAAGEAAHRTFETRLKNVEAVIHNQDNREHDLLDSDDYYQFEGGITAAVRELSGSQPQVYHNDHSRPETPRIRTLDDEIARVVRARVVNPKWIEGVMRHGYKGAFEMAATVDYLFAFAATARCVKDHHFDAVFEAYLGDDDVRDFIQRHNPAALKEMAERLLEAQERNLWNPRLNSTHATLLEMVQ